MIINITFSAEERLIEEARKRAQAEHKSLNAAFRDWLFRYARGSKTRKQYHDIMKKLAYAKPGRRFGRDAMNER